MTCYVCYIYSPDYKSAPLAVFWYEKDAKAWQKQNDYGQYEKLVIK